MNFGTSAGNLSVRAARANDDETFRRASAAWEAGEAELALPEIEQALTKSRD